MRAVRFRPPPLEDGRELRWVLQRAFARPGLRSEAPADPAEALRIAARLDLVPRIAARSGAALLARDLGPDAEYFVEEMLACVAGGLRLEASLRQVVDLAADIGVPVVVLKGVALRLLGLSAPGSRVCCDLDLLAPVRQIPILRAAILREGWTSSPLGGTEYQEAALKHPTLGMVEIHRAIPGVRPAGSRRSFDAGSLVRHGFVQRLRGLPGASFAPTSDVLTAHALSHGLAQHGFAPSTYPLFRFLADLQDLGTERHDLARAAPFLRDLDSGDLDAVETLLLALYEGTALDLPESPARRLLAHLVGAYLDVDYPLALKSSLRSLRRPSDSRFGLATIRSAFSAVLLSRRDVDVLYGEPSLPIGYLGRQLYRPFDLGLRLGRSLWARRPRYRRR